MATFRGIFNWYGENHTLYTYADNTEKAKRNMIKQLQDILGITCFITVASYFYNGDDKHEIAEVIDE